MLRRRHAAVSSGPSPEAPSSAPSAPVASGAMCRNIHTLYNFEPSASEDEVRAAALQYVRKISGFTKPSRANAEAFERAVDDVAAVSARLLDELVTSAPPRDRRGRGGQEARPLAQAPGRLGPGRD